ncbi:MAG: RNA polymerase sigma factor [Planctomycetota bacterium]|jgi:RNA polymerase sigma-70 factor (ECF subfamily)
MTGEASNRQAVATDPASLGALWREHRRWVATVLLAHMPREADLEDLLQDVAVKFVTHIRDLRDPGALRGWLRMIAVNTARMAARRRRLRLAQLPDGDAAPHDPSVETEATRREAAVEAKQALAMARDLPEGYREPLLLRCVDELSQREIAETLGLPETTIETRLARARRMLRDRMAARRAREEAARGPRVLADIRRLPARNPPGTSTGTTH